MLISFYNHPILDVRIEAKSDTAFSISPQKLVCLDCVWFSLQEFHTVQDCLDYFDEHGLVELTASLEEDSYQLPRVTPLEPIAKNWEELPISPEARRSLSDKEMEQQRALWELIYNEHSHLKTLETIINVRQYKDGGDVVLISLHFNINSYQDKVIF